MESGERATGAPNDPNAPEETRPDGCTCTYQTEEMKSPAPASEHDPENPQCPIAGCPDCEHTLGEHGPRGCKGTIWEDDQYTDVCPCRRKGYSLTPGHYE